MYHNVQYLTFCPPAPFVVPSVCSIVLLQCLILVNSLCILLSVDVCVTSVKPRVRMFVKRNKTNGEFVSFPSVLAAFLNLRVWETVSRLLGVCCVSAPYVACVLCVLMYTWCSDVCVLGFECVTRVCACVCNGVFSPLIVCEIVNPDPRRFMVRPTEKKKPHC